MTATGPSEESVALVLARSGGRCERCLVKPATQIHHRCGRQMGGSRNTPWINLPSALAHLCGTSEDGCHGLATRFPGLARIDGWVVSRGEASQLGGCADIPVVDVGGYTWLLRDDGSKQPVL